MENNLPTSDCQAYLIKPRKLVAFVYLLFLLGCVTGGIAAVIGVIFANLQKKEATDSLLLSHLNYQIGIFWPSLIIGIIGVLTIPLLGLGFIITIANIIWFSYRTLLGFLKLNKNESIS